MSDEKKRALERPVEQPLFRLTTRSRIGSAIALMERSLRRSIWDGKNFKTANYWRRAKKTSSTCW